MWTIAIIADLVSFIPFIGGIIGNLIAAIGFAAIGADVGKGSLFSSKQVTATLAALLIEIPLGAIPTWCIRVAFYKLSDKEK